MNPKNVILKLLEIYKKHSTSLWSQSPFVVYSQCKYHPTCSEYTALAIKKYGLAKGTAKGLFRVLRCNPLSKGGINLP